MRLRTFAVATALSIGLLGTLPLLAADPPAASEKTAPAVSAVPAPGSDLFTPAPTFRIGTMQGPCTVSVKCKSGATISCHGVGNCQWRGDNPPTSFGFVRCDSVETDCGLAFAQ